MWKAQGTLRVFGCENVYGNAVRAMLYMMYIRLSLTDQQRCPLCIKHDNDCIFKCILNNYFLSLWVVVNS